MIVSTLLPLPQTTIEAGSAAETACKKNMKNTKD
jgi:hypothetical protein